MGAIPLAALAGVLVATAARMVEVSTVRALLRSSRGDGAVLALTALATVALDLVTAVVLGVLVAGAWRCVRSPGRRLSRSSPWSPHQLVILRMARVATLDATGAAVMRDTIRQLENRGITVLLSGVKARHSTVLDALGVYDRLGHEGHLFATTPEAIAHARMHVARTPHEAA